MTYISSDKVSSGYFNKLTARKNTDCLKIFADNTRNCCLTCSGISRKDHMLVKFTCLKAFFTTTFLNLVVFLKTAYIFLNFDKTDNLIKFFFNALEFSVITSSEKLIETYIFFSGRY